ncbi:hypothetical protein Pint_27078 [Pistacia integerrima]|uniref:Uncharacterized protein n=1 Tax=Pistacia integerrima TaxID=434235 RepID=A0ACC0YQ98_9ROSI|nr:hypothetical protein Pint_27078 [Pistacia integerrima]
MGEAAERLMQLSGEENSSNESEKTKKKKRKLRDQNEVIWATIEEIFGKEEEEEEIFRPAKKRYRSIVSIYMSTKPMPLEMRRS